MNDVWIFDVASRRFTQARLTGDMPAVRYGSVSGVCESRGTLVVVGGRVRPCPNRTPFLLLDRPESSRPHSRASLPKYVLFATEQV